MQGLPDEPRFAATRAHLERVRAHCPDADGLVNRAIEWAIDCHLPQPDRADGAPYVQHVASVAARVLGWAGGEPADTLVAAALLHDSVEDRPARLLELGEVESSPTMTPGERQRAALQVLAAHFDARLAERVGALTNPPDAPELAGFSPESPAYEALSLARYREHFVTLVAGDPDIAAIKIADFADNALRLGSVRDASRYARLVRKYGPCVAFLRDFLPSADAGTLLGRAWTELQPAVEGAWADHFGPRPAG